MAADVSPSGGRRRARAPTSLDAIEAWRSECQRRDDARGLREARTKAREAAAADEARRERLMAMPATTIRDRAIKAAVIRRFTWDDDEAEALLDKLMELDGIDD
jgi:hypothetical protein